MEELVEVARELREAADVLKQSAETLCAPTDAQPGTRAHARRRRLRCCANDPPG